MKYIDDVITNRVLYQALKKIDEHSQIVKDNVNIIEATLSITNESNYRTEQVYEIVNMLIDREYDCDAAWNELTDLLNKVSEEENQYHHITQQISRTNGAISKVYAYICSNWGRMAVFNDMRIDCEEDATQAKEEIHAFLVHVKPEQLEYVVDMIDTNDVYDITYHGFIDSHADVIHLSES